MKARYIFMVIVHIVAFIFMILRENIDASLCAVASAIWCSKAFVHECEANKLREIANKLFDELEKENNDES